MTNVYIFDIDITIANNDHRQHILKYDDATGRIPTQAWIDFTEPSLIIQDPPEPRAQDFMKRLVAKEADIHFITGRREECRAATEDWICKHFGITVASGNFAKYQLHRLIMRQKDQEHLTASQYKEQAFLKLRQEDYLDLGYTDTELNFFFFEDDKYVFPMYNKYGFVMQSPEVFNYINPEGLNRGEEQKWSK